MPTPQEIQAKLQEIRARKAKAASGLEAQGETIESQPVPPPKADPSAIQAKLKEIRAAKAAREPVSQTAPTALPKVKSSTQTSLPTAQLAAGEVPSVATPTPQTTLGKVAKTGVEVIDKVYDAVSGGIKSTFGKIPGGAANIAGQAIGGIWGGLGSVVKQGGRAVLNGGKTGFSLSELKRDVYETAKSTGSFGQNIGEEATPIAMLGGLGKIPQGLLAVSQGYKGVVDAKQAIEQRDPALGLKAGVELLTAGMGAKGALKSRGLVLGRPIKELPQLADDVKRSARGLVTSKAKMLAQDEAAAAKVYREVLNPGKSELKRELKDTIRGQERDIPAFIAKQRVPIEAVNGRLDTTNAIKVMQSRADEVDDALTEQLKQDTKRWFSVSSLEKRAIEDIGKKNLTAFEKNKLVEDIKRITDAERVSRGLSEADDVLLTGSEANNFKRGLYHLSNYDQTVGKSTGDEIKNMARLTKEAIEDNYKTQDVKGINKMLGDYVESIRMLQNAHGRVVKGGVLGKKLNQVIGAFVGAQVGGAPGALAGVEAASRLTNYQLDPLRRTSSAISKLEKAGSETGLERLSKPKVPKAPGSMGEVSKMLAVAPVGVGGGAVDFEKVKDFFMEDSVDENGQTTRVVDPVKLIGVGLLAAGAAYGLKKSVRMKATAQEPGAVKLKGWSFQVPEKVLTNRSVKGDAKLKDIIQSSKVVRPFSIKGEPNGAAWQFFDGKRVHYLLTEVDDRGKELVKTWLKFDRESLSSKGKDESKLLKTLRAESEHSLRNKK